MSPRWVLAHVRALPVESAFMAEFRGGQKYRGWDLDRYMLATVIDVLRAQLYAFVMANSDPKKGKPKAPQPFPIPDRADRRRQTNRPGSFASVAAQMIAAKRKKKEQARWQSTGPKSALSTSRSPQT